MHLKFFRVQIKKPSFSLSFVISFGLHLAILLCIALGFQSKVKMSVSQNELNSDIIQAAVIDEKQIKPVLPTVNEKIEKIDKTEKLEKMDEAQQKQVTQPTPQNIKTEGTVPKAKQDLEKTKEEEEDALAAIRLEKEKERKALEALKKEKAKALKRLQAIDDKRQEEQDRAKELRLEREKEEKKQRESEKKKKEAMELKRKLEEDKKVAEHQAAEEAQIKAENAKRQQWAQGEFRKYESIIKDKIKGCWQRPSGLPAKLQCKLEITAMPDGDVIRVNVVKSSGNAAFDQSAIAAVQKAVPLPFPQSEPEVMNLFRHFTLEFIPDEHNEDFNE